MTRVTFYAILVAAGLITVSGSIDSFAESGVRVSQPTIDIHYLVDLGHNTQYVMYRICASDQILYSQTVMIKSPQDAKEILTQIVLDANTCKNYSAIIKAKYSDNITVEIVRVQFD
ncbi:MAG TPA: hypothetical protein VD689_04895 [Nitrosopumilaceae archaeon]|nr:hypothetical protein [Nitrosopumilaceae archaeon]